MNKLVLGLLGAIAFGASALPSAAAPSIDAVVSTAMFHADSTDARVQTVQYRQDGVRPSPYYGRRPHYRHYRRHHRPHFFRGH